MIASASVINVPTAEEMQALFQGIPLKRYDLNNLSSEGLSKCNCVPGAVLDMAGIRVEKTNYSPDRDGVVVINGQIIQKYNDGEIVDFPVIVSQYEQVDPDTKVVIKQGNFAVVFEAADTITLKERLIELLTRGRFTPALWNLLSELMRLEEVMLKALLLAGNPMPVVVIRNDNSTPTSKPGYDFARVPREILGNTPDSKVSINIPEAGASSRLLIHAGATDRYKDWQPDMLVVLQGMKSDNFPTGVLLQLTPEGIASAIVGRDSNVLVSINTKVGEATLLRVNEPVVINITFTAVSSADSRILHHKYSLKFLGSGRYELSNFVKPEEVEPPVESTKEA